MDDWDSITDAWKAVEAPGKPSKPRSGASTPQSSASSNRRGKSRHGVASGSGSSESSGCRTPSLFAQLEIEAAQVSNPLHIWCLDSGEQQATAIKTYSEDFRYGRAIAFATQATFMRWLFQQPRGDVTPTSVLVVGWREAKPCAMGIAAARSGIVSGLRPDASRGQLSPMCGNPVKVDVIIRMIIIVLCPERLEIASEWVELYGRDMVGMTVRLATSLDAVQAILCESMDPASEIRAATFQVGTTTEASRADAAHMAVVPARSTPVMPEYVAARAVPSAEKSVLPHQPGWGGVVSAFQGADWVGDTIYSL